MYKMKYVLLLLLGTATALAGTHVNISFSQQLSGSKMAQLQNNEAQLNDNDKNNRFARIQVDDKKADIDLNNEQDIVSDVKFSHEAKTGLRSERVQNEERVYNRQRTFKNQKVRQGHGQIRNLSPQDMQNMEFERYIQNYHSGPTVETVYESAKPEMQHTLTTSSQRVDKFERQVVLPAKVENVQSHSDVLKPVVGHQHANPSIAVSRDSLPPSSSSLSPSPSIVNAAGSNGFTHIHKHNYDDPKYNDRHSESHFYNQIPPSVEDSPSGYGGYFGNIYSRQQFTDDYNAAEQRPVVTKTIQIAQPAIKAKKYEVRHPAIQKEFYDIEERVVIKPAGTVVVELERPSAKILKEETTLPLGHPHPAVAAAYMPTKSTQTFSNVIYSSSGSPSLNRPSNQYMPANTYNSKILPEHNSKTLSVSTPSTYEQSSKEDVAETAQNKPYSDTPKVQNREIVVLTDGHGNQRQVSTDQLAYSRNEADRTSFRSLYNNKNLLAYEDQGRATGQNIISQQRSAIQDNADNNEDLVLDAEYISNSGLRKETKPARIQEEPSEEVIERKQQPIIKHEHKIVLSPSQHNIYLSRNHEVPKTKFIEETAEVREIKPYLSSQTGPVVVYASARQIPELNYMPRSEYKPQSKISTQAAQYHNPPKINQPGVGENRVQYSPAYAQLRYHSHEEENKDEHQRHKDIFNQSKAEKLIFESNPMIDVKQSSMKNSIEKQVPQAHIAIKIPSHSSNDDNKPISVDSSIRPMMMDDNRDRTHNTKLEISVTSNRDSKQEETSSDKQRGIDTIDNIADKDSEQLSNINIKPDCVESSTLAAKENYELPPEKNLRRQQKFLRIVEGSTATTAANDAASTAESVVAQPNLKPHNIDAHEKSSSGHINPPGSRVIASTAASKDSAPSESFHKRRIVVNHPFQTVREVVEHEPYTNYHEVQVSEPATPALYNSANYYQPPENKHFVSPTYH